jgi:transposase
MAKSVLDAGWGLLKSQMQYKAQQGGRGFHIVSERNTTRACSGCGSLTGPAGPDSLVVRTWSCSACGDTHDRDVNAARNILSAWRCPTSVSGNESMPSVIAPRLSTSPARGTDKITDGSGMSTGIPVTGASPTCRFRGPP